MWPIGLQNSVLLRADLLNKVSVNIIGVSDNLPCKSVCDLSQNTIMPTGMTGPSVIVQYRFLAGNQASPV